MAVLSNYNREDNVIASALKEVRPHTIAVAYVGKDWKSYCDTFKEIIVSPTIGTNPNALEEIIKEKGIENVYFLDNLHSKIYLGTFQALVGSSNLSKNALSDQNLLETVVSIRNVADLGQIRSILERYKGLAKRAYPSIESKLERIEQLKNMPKIPSVSYKETDLLSYDVEKSNNRIIISWYCNSDIKNSQDSESEFNPDQDDYITFLEQDEIYPGDWILRWRKTNANMPAKREKLYWLKVTNCIPKGDINKENLPYTKIAYQKTSQYAIPPFIIENATVTECFKKLIENERFRDFWVEDEVKIGGKYVWKIRTQERNKEFLLALQQAVKSSRGE